MISGEINGAAEKKGQECAGGLRPGRYAWVRTNGGADFHAVISIFGGGFTLIATFFTLVRIAQTIVQSKTSSWALLALILIAVIRLISILACITSEASALQGAPQEGQANG
ncbi:MAG: hypothetical protein V3T83_01330 [Acidobacteriota bacterium]